MPAATPIKPRRRPLGGPTGGSAVIDRDPLKYYIMVPKNRAGESYGIDHFRQMGYREVRFSKEGAKLAGLAESESIKQGDVQEWMGNVLMEIDLELFNEIQAHGFDGQGGTEMMERIVKSVARQPKQRSRYVREEIDKEMTDQFTLTEA